MSPTPTELSFVEKREKLTRHWPPFGIGILLLLLAFGVWLWVKVPYLINPWAVSSSLEAGTLPESTISLMAAILPFVVLTLLTSSFIVVLLMFVTLTNESRLIRLVRRLAARPENNRPDGSDE